jgi:hypothetical protein
VLAEYLRLVHFEEAGDLTVFGGAVVGARQGLLW